MKQAQRPPQSGYRQPCPKQRTITRSRRQTTTAATATGLETGAQVPPVSRRAVLGVSACGALVVSGLSARAKSEPLLEAATPPVAAPAPLTPREQQIVEVVTQATGSVVSVYDAALKGPRASTPEVDVPEGNGSGIVWDKAVLATSLKALKGEVTPGKEPRIARVVLQGGPETGRVYDGVLVGSDRNRDLVVLRINAPPEQLQPVTLGRSADLKVGQQVLALGSPFGFAATLTTGVVSGLNREIRSLVGTNIPGGIQTDAAINPGNSGGPLLDSKGRVIGLNTAIFTNTGTSVGIGFAIPSDIVARIVPQLISSGRVVRPSLGVQIATDAVAARLRVAKGALIQSLLTGGAAEKAGLLPTRRGLQGIVAGDVIVAIDGQAVATASDVTNVLEAAGCTVGQAVKVLALRTDERGGTVPVEVEVILQAE